MAEALRSLQKNFAFASYGLDSLDCLEYLPNPLFLDRFLAISGFPSRRQGMVNKVRRIADALASELDEAMQKDLLEAINNIENFVKIVARPYQDAAQQRLDKLLAIQHELLDVEKEIQKLNSEIENLHISS